MKKAFAVGDRSIMQVMDSHPDFSLGYGRMGAYFFIGASAVGQMHVDKKKPRDDSFAIKGAYPWLATVVSDGVGSRPMSRYGSSLAADILSSYLLQGTFRTTSSQPPEEPSQEGESDNGDIEHGDNYGTFVVPGGEGKISLANLDFTNWQRKLGSSREQVDNLQLFQIQPPQKTMVPAAGGASELGTITWHLPPYNQDNAATPDLDRSQLAEVMTSAFQKTNQYMIEHAARLKLRSPSDLHCTLLALLLNVETGQVAAGHVGDGLILKYGESDGLGSHALPLVDPKLPGNPGETYVLPSKDWNEHLVCRAFMAEELASYTTFMLMTDGVENDCYDKSGENISSAWAKSMDEEIRKDEGLDMSASRLLYWLANYKIRGSWDDRTLAVICRATADQQNQIT